jgi:protein TonB
MVPQSVFPFIFHHTLSGRKLPSVAMTTELVYYHGMKILVFVLALFSTVANADRDVSVTIPLNTPQVEEEYLPIVKVAPIYPRSAMRRGLEGFCVVEYTVSKSGSILDPFVVKGACDSVFASASLKASLQFKYKPRVVDGEAIEVAGVQNKFTYALVR